MNRSPDNDPVRGHIRPVRTEDLPEFVRLCREHAEYEKSIWIDHPREVSLHKTLIENSRAWGWVLESDDHLGGFATAILEYSTWEAGDYLHLDCLYLRPPFRGQGWGQRLMEEVARTACQVSAANLQWQTPSWNQGAIRFYERLGAAATSKVRFSLSPEGCRRWAQRLR